MPETDRQKVSRKIRGKVQNTPYDILFEQVKIGPVTAPNRFYQAPHCNGMGYRHPRALASMRGIKAEGGWGVVSSEETEIHPTSDISPYLEGRIWHDQDIPRLRLVTEAIHKHGALAAIELVHNGIHSAGLQTRIPPMGPTSIPVLSGHPVHARQMDLKDIRHLIEWYKQAALRAKHAGFDIVYVYAGHSMSLLMHFMQRRYNSRSDHYGGSLQNRVRLTREVLCEVKETVGDSCGVAFRFAVDELMGEQGINAQHEGQEIVSMLADIPDLWDVNISDWSNDSATARFEPDEGYQDEFIAFVKTLTNRPVVGVGRYTSVDAMVGRIKKGLLDFIGAARPSIADPFLPNKIKSGRIDEIRECIGCNICVSSDNLCVPIRCTQNPTMGEEWRRGWHPEKIEKKTSDDKVLVVGAGPAGLECALQLANRGYDVTLAEAENFLGGRVYRECQLPGLASYKRVIDYRIGLLQQKPNVEIYKQSYLDAEAITEFGFPHVVMATGAKWRKDGTGICLQNPVAGLDGAHISSNILSSIFTADDILRHRLPSGEIIVYDDDHYYMGGVIAEHLVEQGCRVTLVTPESQPSAWTTYTLEQQRIHARLLKLGVSIITKHTLGEIVDGKIQLRCLLTGDAKWVSMDSIVMVTARDPVNSVAERLKQKVSKLPDTNTPPIKSITLIGDCLAPSTIASAIYLGHLAARNLQGEAWETALFNQETTAI